MERLFAVSADCASLGWSFTFAASCLEIYNEEVGAETWFIVYTVNKLSDDDDICGRYSI